MLRIVHQNSDLLAIQGGGKKTALRMAEGSLQYSIELGLHGFGEHILEQDFQGYRVAATLMG